MEILRVENLIKDFVGIRALDEVSFTVQKGEIHCLCGENGAGKSTLMKVISGVYAHDTYSGGVFYKGEKQKYNNIKDSEEKGIAIIHQELALSPFLSIVENIFIGHQYATLGILDNYKMNKEARLLLNKVGLQENLQTIVSKLGLGKQQLVEIAKALSKNIELLILDEPTSSLNDEESSLLLNLILELKKEGITCIMISHKLNEVLKVADAITILRDGKTINTFDTTREKITETMIIKDMVGRDLNDRFPKRNVDIGEVVFEVKNWTVYHPERPEKEIIRNANLKVRKGEIVGVCGLMGSGRTELMMSVFGSSYGSHHKGEVFLHGKKRKWRTPKDAIADGLGYVSEDRKELGLIQIQDVKFNITNSNLINCSKWGIINNYTVEKSSLDYKDKMNIKCSSVHNKVNTLSGGNQQKVVLSRCLFADPDVLIIDEPTRGIDVGAKHEIYLILNELVGRGRALIVVSSELEEILGISDRIYVMHSGSIKGELTVKDATQEKIMAMAIGNRGEKE